MMKYTCVAKHDDQLYSMSNIHACVSLFFFSLSLRFDAKHGLASVVIRKECRRNGLTNGLILSADIVSLIIRMCVKDEAMAVHLATAVIITALSYLNIIKAVD